MTMHYQPGFSAHRSAHPRRDSVVRDMVRLYRKARGESVTVRDAAEIFAEHSAPLLLVFLGLLGVIPALPLGVVVGLLVICVSLSMLLPGSSGPFIPQVLGRRHLPPKILQRLMRIGVPLVRRLERYCRPRLFWLTSGPGLGIAAITIALQGIGFALPLPFGNTPFAFGIVLTAFGLLTRDGLLTLAGHIVGLVSAGFFTMLGIGAAQGGAVLGSMLPW